MTSPNTIIANLVAEVETLRKDLEESDAVRNSLAVLLSETAVALKGEEAELHRHSWHDLPAVALAAMIEVEMLKKQRDELLAALEGMVGIARMTIGWSCTPANADGPLAVAEKGIASVKGGAE